MTDRLHIEDLLAAYAIDAVDVDERVEAERLLRQDPALWEIVAGHHEVMGFLAETVETAPSTPSPMVWEHIITTIEGHADVTPVFRPAADERRNRWFSRAAIAFSAAALVVSGLVAVVIVNDAPEDQLQVAVDELLRDPAAQVVTMAAPEGGSLESRVVIGDDGIGYIYADNLPDLGADRTYQLWAIVDGAEGQQIISAGIIGSDPDISPFQVTGDLVGLAITNEIAGGVVTSEEAPTTLWLASA